MSDASMVRARRPAGDDPGLLLVSRTRPFLNRFDEEGLRRHLHAAWVNPQLVELLEHASAGVARTAAVCLGLVGTFDDTPALARILHHDDYFVVCMAERALWGIWLRSSDEKCCALLRLAIECIHRAQGDRAEELLEEILVRDPDFAEACNQRAVLHYLSGRSELSILACHRALALNRYHFGAAAGLGHNHLRRGDYRAATEAYRRTLRLHPRMEGVRQALRRMRDAVPARGARPIYPQAPRTVFAPEALAGQTNHSCR